MAWRAFIAWFLALLLLLLALLSLALRVVLPNYPALTDALLASIHDPAGLSVQAEQMKLDWRGTQAVVLATGLDIERGSVQMQVGSARLYVDLYRSLVEQAPRFDRIELIDLSLALAPPKSDGQPLDPQQIIGLLAAPLSMASDVRLGNARLTGAGWAIDQLNGRLSQVDQKPRLNFSAQLRLPQMGSGLRGRLELTDQGARGYVRYEAQGQFEPRVDQWSSTGELWAFAGDQPLRLDWRGQLESEGDQLQGLGQIVQRADGGWQGSVSRLNGQISGKQVKVDQARAVWRDGLTLDVAGGRLGGYPERLSNWLPENLVERLRVIDPSIELTQGYFDQGLGYWRLGQSQSQPYQGIPGGSFAKADLVTQGTLGVADVSEISSFHSLVVGADSIEMQRGGGVVAWQRTGDRRWTISGQGLDLIRDDLSALGRFDIALSPEPNERRFDLLIQANSAGQAAQQWAPLRLFGEAGQRWWQTATPEMQLQDGLFWWHNGVDRYRALTLTATDLGLTPASGWPRANVPIAQFEWDGQAFDIRADNGQMGLIPVSALRVSQTQGKPWRVRASTRVNGKDAQAIVESLPITLGSWVNDVALSGPIQSQLDLSIGSTLSGQIRFAPQGIEATWQPLALSAQNVTGQVLYQLNQGLLDSQLSGDFDGRPLKLVFDDGAVFGLTASGKIDVSQAAQRYAPVIAPYLSGLSDVQARVTDTWSVQLPLQASQSDLPVPLDSGGMLRISGDDQRIELRMDGQAELRIAGNQWAGRADQADLIGWAQVLGQSDTNESTGGDLEVDFQVGSTLLGDLKVGASRLSLVGDRLSIDGPNAKASIAFANPLLIQIDKLHGTTPEAEPAEPEYQRAPANFPAMQVNARDIKIDDSQIDSLQVNINPTDAGVRFAPFSLELGGAQVTAQALWSADTPRSSMQAEVQLTDLGTLLDSQGYARALETESGRISMDLAWTGYPWAPQFKKSTGDLSLSADQGRFLDGPNAAEALRLLGIFNLGTITRRLRLDFSDLLKPGLAFDSLAGKARLRAGRLSIVEPLTLRGPGSSMFLTGSSDLSANTLDHRLRVQVPLSAQLPAATLLAGFPALAAGVVLLVDQVAGDRLSRIGETNYAVTGTFDAPVVEPLKPEAQQ